MPQESNDHCVFHPGRKTFRRNAKLWSLWPKDGAVQSTSKMGTAVSAPHMGSIQMMQTTREFDARLWVLLVAINMAHEHTSTLRSVPCCAVLKEDIIRGLFKCKITDADCGML